MFQVDLVEPVSHFLEAAKEDLSINSRSAGKAANFYCIPLQVMLSFPITISIASGVKKVHFFLSHFNSVTGIYATTKSI